MKYIKSLYNWVLSWANSPYATPALFILAFTESSFFPIPPDVLLIALSISRPEKAFYYVLISSIGSVFGGIFGYFIGAFFMNQIGMPIVIFYSLENEFLKLQELFRANDWFIVLTAGFTPIPYKLCTITAGMVKINFATFVFVSILSRSARFLFLGVLIYFFGNKIKIFIDKYFNILTIIFTVFLIGGFLLVKVLLRN